jgi:hypothetical protein
VDESVSWCAEYPECRSSDLHVAGRIGAIRRAHGCSRSLRHGHVRAIQQPAAARTTALSVKHGTVVPTPMYFRPEAKITKAITGAVEADVEPGEQGVVSSASEGRRP